MSYLVEQPPHCDLLRLSPRPTRFVLMEGRLTSAAAAAGVVAVAAAAAAAACVMESAMDHWVVGSVSFDADDHRARCFYYDGRRRSAAAGNSARVLHGRRCWCCRWWWRRGGCHLDVAVRLLRRFRSHFFFSYHHFVVTVWKAVRTCATALWGNGGTNCDALKNVCPGNNIG